MKLKLVMCMLLGSGLLGLASESAEAVCLDGCSSIALSLGDYVFLSTGMGSNCTACGSGTVYAYTVKKLNAGCGICNDEPSCPQGTFCSTSDVSAGEYVVQSIGSGCSGAGCIRLCPCP